MITRVCIVDDHQLFADGLATALNAIPDMSVTGVYSTGESFLEALEAGILVDVILLDLEMPGLTGLDVLASPLTQPPAILVTMHTGDAERRRAVDLGAAGFLSKSTPLLDLAAAIRAVADGRLVHSDTTLREIWKEYGSPILDPGAQSLTPRERELLGLLASGVSSTDELSDRLYISQKTVKNHLASIYEKLAVSDRAQAAVEAIRLGLHSE
ncbi:MAG: response regulator transcription factor [Acidimicrobiia bacterium]|nr:response regulator transcription factor [Acidimicrobiia bacterium]